MAQVEDEWVFTMREVFQEAQTQIISNEPYKSLNAQENDSFFAPFARRFVKILSNEVPSNDVQEFIEEIWIALGRILLETQVKVEIVIGFASLIGTFIGLDLKSASKKSVNQRDSIQPEVLDRVRNEILERLMDATRVEDKSVRLKACQMLQVILNKLEFIEEILFDKLRDTLLVRAHDKIVTIRVQSVYALKRLQDPSDEKDPATVELLRTLVSDPSKDVRKAAVESIAVTKISYQDLLIRLRDTSEEVRAAVFQVLGDCLELDEIPINDRANIIEQGLEDRSELVQNACKRVILTKWLPACEDSPVVLLKALDVEQFTEVGVKVSRTLLEEFVARDPYYEPEIYDAIGALSISSVSKGKLLPEDVLYWKEQCAFFSSNSNGNGSNRKADICNKLIPSLSDFCKLIKATAPVPECIFATQQLLLLGQSLDFQDEFGRRHLVQTIQKILQDLKTDNQLIPGLVDLMAKVYSNTSEHAFIQVVTELLSDIYDPFEEQQEEMEQISIQSQPLSGLKTPTSITSTKFSNNYTTELSKEEHEKALARFEELENQLEEMDEDDEKFEFLQQELMELEALLQDPKVLQWLRCLDIIVQTLRLISIPLRRNPMLSGMGKFILPAIESDVPALRETGMESLGLFCLLDQEIAQRHVHIFWKAFQNKEEEKNMRMMSLKALFDILGSYSYFQPENFTKKNTQEIILTTEIILQALSKEMKLLCEKNIFQLEENFLSMKLDFQCTIVEGFAKLFMLERIEKNSLLQKQILCIMLQTYVSPLLTQIQLNTTTTKLNSSQNGFQTKTLQILSVFFPAFLSNENCFQEQHAIQMEEATILLIQQIIHDTIKKIDKNTIIEEQDQLMINCVKYCFHLLGNNLKMNFSRIGLEICVEILAFLQFLKKKKKTTFFSNKTILIGKNLLKNAMKMLCMIDIQRMEKSSFIIWLALLKEILADQNFQQQKILVRSMEALLKRSEAIAFQNLSDQNKKQKTKKSFCEEKENEKKEKEKEEMEIQEEEEENKRKKDFEFIAQKVTERELTFKKILMALNKKKTKSRKRGRTTLKKSARGSSDDEDDMKDDEKNFQSDESSDDSIPEGYEKKRHQVEILPTRTLSTRRSKTVAVDRMLNKDFEIAMKIEEEEDDEEENNSDEDDEDEEFTE